MAIFKTFDNGLKVVINKLNGMYSVSTGILVKTGSINETERENGISHFIEHVMFKGTTTRSAFDISSTIDDIGASINAFTSKEMTCYYTKSTKEHLEKAIEVLSDMFFNSVFDKTELKKERGVIIEEINMSEDSPEDLCLDLLAKSYHGDEGLGQTILGPAKNIRRFDREDVLDYMAKYYTADNVAISIVGNVDEDKTLELIEKYFATKFSKVKSKAQTKTKESQVHNLFKSKKIEQTHIAFALPAYSMFDDRSDKLAIANTVLGGGMSSRLFQKIREELGLCYSVYSYFSQYKDSGVFEVYAGVNTESRDKACEAVINELLLLKEKGITEQEFKRAKEQIKSGYIMGRENTASQMMLYGRYLLFLDKKYNFKERINRFEKITLEDVNETVKRTIDLNKIATATVGKAKTPLKIF